jgi:hypothetical protein
MIHSQADPEDVEQIRERLANMSDLELRKYGRAARDLADPKKNFGPPNPSFKIQTCKFSFQPDGSCSRFHCDSHRLLCVEEPAPCFEDPSRRVAHCPVSSD